MKTKAVLLDVVVFRIGDGTFAVDGPGSRVGEGIFNGLEMSRVLAESAGSRPTKRAEGAQVQDYLNRRGAKGRRERQRRNFQASHTFD